MAREYASSFTPEQKAFIREVVYEVLPAVLDSHVQHCPWGRKISRFVWIGLGIGVAASLLGISSLSDLMKFLR